MGYSCLPNIGDNPDNGYLSYDNLGWALIAVDQILTLDNTDDLYDKVFIAALEVTYKENNEGLHSHILFLMLMFFSFINDVI